MKLFAVVLLLTFHMSALAESGIKFIDNIDSFNRAYDQAYERQRRLKKDRAEDAVAAQERDEYVRGYRRTDGTYVEPHYRTQPNNTKSD